MIGFFSTNDSPLLLADVADETYHRPKSTTKLASIFWILVDRFVWYAQRSIGRQNIA